MENSITKNMNRTKRISKETNYIMGYELPKFTDEKRELSVKYQRYKSWTPGMKMFIGDSIESIPYPQPDKVEISYQLLEKIEMFNEWRRVFNRRY